MLERAMDACPPELWSRPASQMGFWYLAYHSLFFLDYDFSPAAEVFCSAAFDVHEYELRELNLLLRQNVGSAPLWVRRTKQELYEAAH